MIFRQMLSEFTPPNGCFPLRICIVPQKYWKLPFWNRLPNHRTQILLFSHIFFFKSNVVYHLQLVSLSVSELLKTFSSLKIIPPTKDETVLPQEFSKDS